MGYLQYVYTGLLVTFHNSYSIYVIGERVQVIMKYCTLKIIRRPLLMNVFSNSKDKTLNNQLNWINEPAEWNFTEEILTIAVPESSDFFQDPAGISIQSTAPFLYSEVEGDFSLTTRVNVEMIEEYDSGCLMVMVDDKNWAKLCYEYINKIPTIVSVVTKNVSDDCISEKIGQVKPYLKILRAGNCFGFHYSLDAINWTLVRYFAMDAPSKLKVGVVGQCPVGKRSKVIFECFYLEAKHNNNARVVDQELK